MNIYFIRHGEATDNVKGLISEGKCNYINNVIGKTQGMVAHKEKDNVIKLAVKESTGAYYLENNNISYNDKLENVAEDDFENIDEDSLFFYTTETIEELMSSYKKYSEIDLRELRGTSVKKVKKHT